MVKNWGRRFGALGLVVLVVGAVGACKRLVTPEGPTFRFDWGAPVAVPLEVRPEPAEATGHAVMLHVCPRPDGSLEIRDRGYRLLPHAPAPRVHQAYATMLVDANGNLRDALAEESTIREDSLRGLSPSFAGATGFDPDFVRKTIADEVTSERVREGTILQWQLWVGLWLRYDPQKPLPQEVELKLSPADTFVATIRSVQAEAGDPFRARMKGRFVGSIHPASEAEKVLLREPKHSAVATQEVYEVEAVVKRPSLRPLEVRVRRGIFTRPEGKQVSASVNTYAFDWAKAEVGAGVCPAPPPAKSLTQPFFTTPKPAGAAAVVPVRVSVAAAGIDVAVDGAVLAPGCDKPGPGPTVRMGGGAATPTFDADALSGCAAKVAKGKPDVFAYTIRAEPGVPFRTIIAVMDALRPSGLANPMFQPSSGSFPAPCAGTLPPLPSGGQPSPGITITVSKSQIFLGEKAKEVVPLPTRPKLVSGVAVEHKRCGAGDYLILPLRDAVGRKASGPPGGTQALVIVDSETPYRLLLEVLYTLGQAGVGKYELMMLKTAG